MWSETWIKNVYPYLHGLKENDYNDGWLSIVEGNNIRQNMSPKYNNKMTNGRISLWYIDTCTRSYIIIWIVWLISNGLITTGDWGFLRNRNDNWQNMSSKCKESNIIMGDCTDILEMEMTVEKYISKM